MTDQPEQRKETEDVDADFEGHRITGPEKAADISDTRMATDDDGADFEGHVMKGPEKSAKQA